jgi:hypothetical protein
MNLRHRLIPAILLLAAATPAVAQVSAQPVAHVQPQPAAAEPVGTTPPPPAFDVSRLPVNIERIQRRLAQSREREERDGLNLRYMIDVFGQAPPIELLTKDDNLLYGPVPESAPTHRDMLNMMTPKEFRSPAMDFNSLFRWLSDKSKK